MDGTKGPRTIAITSGKGGVGKTNLAVNLCLALAEQGAKTCLLDADLGLANVNVLMGLEVGATLEDVVFGRAALDDIILRDRHGIDIIPGSSGVERMADLGGRELESLLESFSRLGEYDFFLMDTSAGISKNVTAFCLGASEVILVLLPEPASMTDAYALLKVLDRNGFKGVVKVVVSQCKTVSAARKCYALLKETADRFLGARLALAGVIIHDQKVPAAIAKRVPVIKSYPGSNASRCIRHLAKTLLGQGAARAGDGGLPGFWTRFLGILKAPLELGGVEEENEAQGPVPDQGSAQSPGPDYARLLSVLESLTRELASVGGELRQTREAMESLFASGMKLQQAAERNPPSSICLDFEAFAEERGGSEGRR